MSAPAAYIYDAVRTPFGRYAAPSCVRPDDLGAQVVRSLLERVPHLDPAAIDDVLFGNANGAGEDNRDVARMAVLLAGLPTSVPDNSCDSEQGRLRLRTVDRTQKEGGGTRC